MRTILIDGDVVAYQFACVAEEAIDWGDEMWTLHADLTKSKSLVASYLEELRRLLKADGMIICLSDTNRGEIFRRKIFPTYKANRKVRKPLVFWALVDWMKESFESFARPHLEGDDVLGILATSDKIVAGEKVIVSIDKDMKTIPGWLYQGQKNKHNVPVIMAISKWEADYNHLLQTLIGDVTDGYPGCPGIGPVGAACILRLDDDEDRDVLWSRVVAAFEDKGFGSEYALTQARVARILRASDYDFEKKEPILWTPDQPNSYSN